MEVQVKEKFIVPALGGLLLILGMILPSVFVSVLGLAALGTYFLPSGVQVELRIAIAALGLVVLYLIYQSFDFWLALAAFVVMGGMQINHRRALRTRLHTVDFVKSLRESKTWQKVAAKSGTVVSDAANATQSHRARISGSSEHVRFRGGPAAGGLKYIQLAASKGPAAMAVVVLAACFLAWLPHPTQRGGFASAVDWLAFSFDLPHDAALPPEYLEWIWTTQFVVILIILLGLLGIVSIFLKPSAARTLGGILGFVGIAALLLMYFRSAGIFEKVEIGWSVGFWLATFAFLLMLILSVLPRIVATDPVPAPPSDDTGTGTEVEEQDATDERDVPRGDRGDDPSR